ncbi:PQQ-binding-like beta-propeller repeat protein [Mucilaginibacter sp. AW1-7]|jgi:outer membrane protein assembly factor BamB|uniref:outer membrane protein assembly factor BamB family protein n=1 Tax=Mucilaginibacter sp. AW1-7 TaxID=3349874 RepID=UPI003F731C53
MKSLILILLFMAGCGLKNQKMSDKNRNIISSSLTISGPLLTYSTWSNEIVVENLKLKKIVFTKKIISTCYAQPVLIENKLYFPIADSIFTCVDIVTSKTIWNTPLGGRCSEFHMIDNSIIANSKSYGLIGIDPKSGKIKFELRYKYGSGCTIPDLSPYRMTFDKKAFYVCDWQCKNLSAYNIEDGENLWQKTVDFSSGNIKYVDGVLFWGRNKFYKEGQITLIDPKNGSVLYEEQAKFEENFNPVVYAHKVYYYSYDGKLNEFDVKKRKNKVVYVFKAENDVSGNQMYLLNGCLYYSAQGNVYELSLKFFTNKLVRSNTKDIYGVYPDKSRIEFIL